jgi:hypothetical protein
MFKKLSHLLLPMSLSTARFLLAAAFFNAVVCAIGIWRVGVLSATSVITFELALVCVLTLSYGVSHRVSALEFGVLPAASDQGKLSIGMVKAVPSVGAYVALGALTTASAACLVFIPRHIPESFGPEGIVYAAVGVWALLVAASLVVAPRYDRTLQIVRVFPLTMLVAASAVGHAFLVIGAAFVLMVLVSCLRATVNAYRIRIVRDCIEAVSGRHFKGKEASAH